MSRQRGARRPPDRFAGVSGFFGGSPDTPGFVAYGTACTVFGDTEVASGLEGGTHLLQRADGGATVDRYDVRLLLDAGAGQAQLRGGGALPGSQPVDDVTEEALEAERYADLGGDDAPGGSGVGAERSAPKDPVSERQRAPADGTYREVGFTYASGGGGGAAEDGSAAHGAAGADASAAGRQAEAPQYVPRFDVPIPARLAGRLPLTEREQKIMAQTARFVREAGGQAEFVLRVRQAANPAFAFLAPGDRCHAYFRWLLEAAPQELPDEPRMDGVGAVVGPGAGNPGGSGPQPNPNPVRDPHNGDAPPATAESSALLSLHMYADASDAESRGPAAPDAQGPGNGAAPPGASMRADTLAAGSQGSAAAEEGFLDRPSREAPGGAMPGAAECGRAAGQQSAVGDAVTSAGAGVADAPLAGGTPTTEPPGQELLDGTGEATAYCQPASGGEQAAHGHGPLGVASAAEEAAALEEAPERFAAGGDLEGAPGPAQERPADCAAAAAADSHMRSAAPGPSLAGMAADLDGRSAEGALAGDAEPASEQGAGRGGSSGAAPGAEGDGTAAVDQAGGGQVLAEAGAGALAAKALAAPALSMEGAGILHEAEQAASYVGREQGTGDGRSTGAPAGASGPEGAAQDGTEPAADARAGAPGEPGSSASASGAAVQSLQAGAAAAHASGGGRTGPTQGELLPGAPAAQRAAGEAAKPSVGGESPAAHQGDPPMPPEDVRAIVAKLVPFIKKNGVRFEAVVAARETGNPRFAFLQPGSPYHWFYRSELAAVLPEAAAAASAARAAAGAAPAPRAHQPASAPASGPSNTGTVLHGAPAEPAAPPWLRHAAGSVPGQGPGSAAAQAPAGTGSKPPPWLALRANPRIAAVASAQRPANRPEGEQASGGVGPQLENGPDADPDVDPDSGPADDVAGDSEGGGSEASDRDLPGLSFGDEGDGAAARPPGRGFGEGTEGTLAGSAAAGGVPALPAVMAAEAGGAGGAALALTDAERKARRRRLAKELLAKRAEASAAVAAAGAESATADAIARHRAALLAMEDDDPLALSEPDAPTLVPERAAEEEREPGEIPPSPEPAPRPAAGPAAGFVDPKLGVSAPPVALPRLEEVLRPRPVLESPCEGASASKNPGRGNAGIADGQERRSSHASGAARRSHKHRRERRGDWGDYDAERSGNSSGASAGGERAVKRRKRADKEGKKKKGRRRERGSASPGRDDKRGGSAAGSAAPSAGSGGAGGGPAQGAQNPAALGVSAADVPDALRARLRAMLARGR